MNYPTLYTITNGLDIELIQPNLWKALIIQQKALEKTLETYLIVTNQDRDVLCFVSEDRSIIELVQELLGIKSLSSIEEVKVEVVEQYGSQLGPHDILAVGRLVCNEQILPDDSHLWYH